MENTPITAQDELVTVTLSGALSLNRKVSFKKATEIASFLASANESTAPISGSSIQTSLVPKPAGSALEIIRNSKAKTFPEKITALACYVTRRDNSEFFDPKDIQSLLRRMGNPPQNFGRDLQRSADLLGYVSQEASGQYVVTDRGKEMVDRGFQGDEKVSQRRRVRKVRGQNQ